MRFIRQTWWAGLATCCSAVVMTAGMSFMTAPAQAAFELPEGERITHLPVVTRAIPQKEEYELYDPKIGKNFDLQKFWIRADLRVRPVMRNNVCFGSTIIGNGACNRPNRGTTPNGTPGKQNDFYWSNTGIAHDGVMLQYSTKAWDTYGGWFRTSESDLGQAVPVGAQNPNI